MLITVAQIKAIAPVHQNVEDSKLVPPITFYQETEIKSALGSKLYDDVVAHPAQTTPADYVALIADYIKPALIWGAFSHGFYELHYQFSQKGIMVSKDQFSEPVEPGVLKQIQEDYKGKAQYYMNRLIDHLKAKASQYPKYSESPTDCEDKMPKKDVPTTGGLFI